MPGMPRLFAHSGRRRPTFRRSCEVERIEVNNGPASSNSHAERLTLDDKPVTKIAKLKIQFFLVVNKPNRIVIGICR